MLTRTLSRSCSLVVLLVAAACDSANVSAVAQGDGGSDVPSNRDACATDTDCPYYGCECEDGYAVQGAVCASFGCESWNEICTVCDEHGGQGRSYLWDPGDWPDGAEGGVIEAESWGDGGPGSLASSGGASSAAGGGAGGSGGSNGGSGTSSNGGSGASNGGSGSSNAGSGASAGAGGETGVMCEACPTQDSAMIEYTFSCMGECTGMGSVSFAAGPSYSCNAQSPIGDSFWNPSAPNGFVYADGWVVTGPDDFPPSDVPAIAFDGYAGGLEFPADLETCPKRESPNFINVEGAYSGVPDVKVTCTNKDTGETEADRWLSISKDTKDERVCDDCFAQSGYASFIGGFTYSGTVGLTVGSRTLMGQCLVTGSFRTSGCDTNVQCVP